MCSESDQANGYRAKDLKTWAARTGTWAEGRDPEDLPHIGKLAPKVAARDVFVYFISAAKERNPAAAVALGKLADGA
jgi:uncharacterized protein YecE (DUF72 family)